MKYFRILEHGWWECRSHENLQADEGIQMLKGHMH